MSSRDERLWWESKQLEEYVKGCPVDAEGHPLVEIADRRSAPPDWYLLTYRCQGLVQDPETRQVGVAINHQVEFRIGESYPSSPPVIWATTPIFHPNIGDGMHGGYVCLADDYGPDVSLTELVRRVGEMIRLAQYWDVPTSHHVYEHLQQHRDRLPVDPRSFPTPLLRHPPQVKQTLRVEFPEGGVVLKVVNPGNLGLPEIAAQIARKQDLPLYTADGQPIHYKLEPKGGPVQAGQVFVLESMVVEGNVQPQAEVDFIQRFLEQTKEANPDVFDFAWESSSKQERLYRLTFHLETFAPAVAAGGKQVYVRTKHNEAHLHVPETPYHEPLSVTWLTPIFHPYIEQGIAMRIQGRRPGEPEIATLFQTLVRLLKYEPRAALEVRNQQAHEWVQQNEDRVEWLRQNNPSFILRQVEQASAANTYR